MKNSILAVATVLALSGIAWSQALSDVQRAHLTGLAKRAEIAVRKSGYQNAYAQDGQTYYFSRLWGCRDESGGLRLSLMLLRRGGGPRACKAAFSLDALSRVGIAGGDELVELRLGGVFIDDGEGQDDGPAVRCILFGRCERFVPGIAAGFQRAASQFSISPEGAVAGPDDAEALRRDVEFWLGVPDSAVR